MRWDNLRLLDPSGGDASDPPAPLPLFEQGAVVRTFDTPEFRGVTFYEVHAKSIINRVPEASRVPFRWTINPYRGCTHACSYCLEGQTPILMANGRTKPISDLRVGESVFGTVRQGSYRRYVATDVQAHWSTVKPAFRIRLEDGTELTASGDHRFLTRRGWKHVTGRGGGPEQRPFLTLNDELLGTGWFASAPVEGPEYQRGYLCGMIRGDAHLGSYAYARPGGGLSDVDRFRLAPTDLEALARTRRYLDQLHITTREFVFQEATAERKHMGGIRTQTRSGVSAIEEVIAWPRSLSDDWCKGFLSGIFDAEGSWLGGILRIPTTDRAIIDRIGSSLRRFGFPFVLEQPRSERAKPMMVIRVTGGLREHLRFFLTVDPAVTRKRTIPEGMALKSDANLRVAAVDELGIDLPMYDITTGTGDFIANGVVSHNCFARNTHTYLDMDYGEDFDSKIVVKVNAPDLLRRELAKRTWKGEHIALGTNVDPYQRAEGRYRLTRGVLEALRDAANPFSILTKGSLILRDLDVLTAAASVTDVGANVSVGSMERDLWRSVEPGTPSPQKRLEVCSALNAAGVGCGVLMAPILPYLSDSPSQLEATVKAIAGAGAVHVTPIVLHLRPGAREWYTAWLEREHPSLVPKYLQLYGRGSYAPKAYQQGVTARVHDLARRFGIGRAGPHDARRVGHVIAAGPPAPAPSPAPPEHEQLALM